MPNALHERRTSRPTATATRQTVNTGADVPPGVAQARAHREGEASTDVDAG
jgi:hypothetical protein